jgi:hypothetical protein
VDCCFMHALIKGETVLFVAHAYCTVAELQLCRGEGRSHLNIPRCIISAHAVASNQI